MNGHGWRIAVVTLLLGAGGLVVVLARQNQGLREETSALRRRLSLPQPGAFVPTFRAAALTGDSLTVGEASPGARQILLVFTTTCPYCLASLPAWRRIAGSVRESSHIHVVGISLDPVLATSRYVQVHELSFPIVTFPQRKLAVLYRARSVPVVLVLDAEGRVLYSRVGELTAPAAIDSVLAAARGTAAPARDRSGALK